MTNTFCYIHIPFCSSKCKYCKFASFSWIDEVKKQLYVDYLIQEIQTAPFQLEEGSFLQSIYFWWWTPGVLSLSQVENIIWSLKQKYIFDENIEINIEATPITVTKENVVWWKKLWVNRISIGLQTLNTKSLEEIWRWEKWNILDSLDTLQEAWFNNVSVDFIIWLPYVIKGEVQENIKFVLEKYDCIKHCSVYMLEEYYYPWNWEQISISEEDYLSEYEWIYLYLKERGWRRYELSNFAKPWYECVHNKAYWDHSNMFAFWLWAHWYINNTRFSNSEKFIEYYSWEWKNQEMLSWDDIKIEKLMFMLRTTWITKDILCDLNNNKIKDFIESGYLEEKNNTIQLTLPWVLVIDYILSEILE